LAPSSAVGLDRREMKGGLPFLHASTYFHLVPVRSSATERMAKSDSSRGRAARTKLLEAAIRVFAASGFRGATTRRIAEVAGVNEVTLFRLFRSKEALLREAARHYASHGAQPVLPERPVRPLEEVTAWCARQLEYLRRSRSLIRKCMAEASEHPEMAHCMRHAPSLARMELESYAEKLNLRREARLSRNQVKVACSMLMSVLFADAMGRDVMPSMYPRPVARAPRAYAEAFLRLMGLWDEVGDGGPLRSRSNAADLVTS